MRIIKRMRKQTCIYWAIDKMGEEGQRTFKAPVEVRCRWEDVNEQYIDHNGAPQTSSAKVFVDRDMSMLGVLWLPPNNRRIDPGVALAQLVDNSSPPQPFKNPGAFEIRKFDKMPTLRQLTDEDVVRICWL